MATLKRHDHSSDGHMTHRRAMLQTTCHCVQSLHDMSLIRLTHHVTCFEVPYDFMSSQPLLFHDSHDMLSSENIESPHTTCHFNKNRTYRPSCTTCSYNTFFYIHATHRWSNRTSRGMSSKQTLHYLYYLFVPRL